MSRSSDWRPLDLVRINSGSRERSTGRRKRIRRGRFETLENRFLLAVTLSPVVEASIHDEPRDGIGYSFNSSTTLIREVSSREDRAIA